MTPLASTEEHDMKWHHKAKSLGLLYDPGNVDENASHWKGRVFLMKTKKKKFSHLLESGIGGLFQFGFLFRHPEAGSGLSAPFLWLLKSLCARTYSKRRRRPWSTQTGPHLPFHLIFFFYTKFTSFCHSVCIFVNPFQNKYGVKIKSKIK